MSAYRYLVFPKHQQPTAEEAAEFESYAPLLKRRFAIGRERKSESLCFAFEIEVFDQAMAADEGFEILVRKWQVHGCKLVDKLKFVKDPSALQPKHVHVQQRHMSQEKIVFAKKYLAQEAIARSLLGVQHTLERQAWLRRVGGAVPYALIALGTISVIAAGFYVTGRIQNSDRERRLNTIERVATDAMNENVEITTDEQKNSE